MPFVISQGVRIHYQSEGAGPPLVLQHGYTQNVELWHRFGYVEALKPHYRLILIDARGHGASDKPHDGANYVWPVMVADALAVLDALKLTQAAFWGYSMGGAIVLGLAQHAPERVQALIVGGASAYASTRALAVAAQAQPSPSMDSGLSNMSLPCLFYAGDNDRVFPKTRATAEQIPHAVFVPLSGLDHQNAFMRADLVVPHVLRFLSGCGLQVSKEAPAS